MKKILVFLSLFLLMTACATTEERLQNKNFKPLSQAELEALYGGGQTVRFRTENTYGKVTYHTNGTAKITWTSGRDTGKYDIRDGKICSQWGHIRDGKETCFTIYKVGENKYKAINPNGGLNSGFSFE